MTKTLSLLSLSLFLCALSARAETCTDLKTCTKLMNDLEGQRYIWDAKVNDLKFVGSPDVAMTRGTADLVFTALLDQLGLARVPVGDGTTFRVVKAEDRRDLEMPVLEASADHAPVFPGNSWDWVQLRYHVKTPAEASYIESSYRKHVPRDSLVESDENAGLVLVTAPMPVVRKMYDTIRTADKPLSAAMLEKIKEREKMHLQARFPLGPVLNSVSR